MSRTLHEAVLASSQPSGIFEPEIGRNTPCIPVLAKTSPLRHVAEGGEWYATFAGLFSQK